MIEEMKEYVMLKGEKYEVKDGELNLVARKIADISEIEGLIQKTKHLQNDVMLAESCKEIRPEREVRWGGVSGRLYHEGPGPGHAHSSQIQCSSVFWVNGLPDVWTGQGGRL